MPQSEFHLDSSHSHFFGDANVTSSTEIGFTKNAEIIGLNLPEMNHSQIMSQVYITDSLK